MSEDDEMAELARRYVELWQDQMRAVATDPETARAMAVLTRLWMPWMTGGMTGTAGVSQPGPTDRATPEADPTRDDDRPEPASPPPRSQAAGAASGDGDVDLGELARRLDSLERRIADLDTTLRAGRPSPRRRPGGDRRAHAGNGDGKPIPGSRGGGGDGRG